MGRVRRPGEKLKGDWTIVGGQMVLLHAVEHGTVPLTVSRDGLLGCDALSCAAQARWAGPYEGGSLLNLCDPCFLEMTGKIDTVSYRWVEADQCWHRALAAARGAGSGSCRTAGGRRRLSSQGQYGQRLPSQRATADPASVAVKSTSASAAGAVTAVPGKASLVRVRDGRNLLEGVIVHCSPGLRGASLAGATLRLRFGDSTLVATTLNCWQPAVGGLPASHLSIRFARVTTKTPSRMGSSCPPTPENG